MASMRLVKPALWCVALSALACAPPRGGAPEDGYRFVAGAAGVHTANPAQGFTASLGSDGVAIRPVDPAATWRLELALRGYGCEGAAAPVGAGAPAAAGARVEVRRGAGLTEWYLNGPGGLEQGFTLASSPGCDRLALELEVGGGLTPEVEPAGDALALRTPSGGAVLRYGELAAVDARGRALPARLTLAGGRAVIHVDATGAAFPVTVDPIVATQQAKLTASDGAKDDELGISVAIDGQTAVAGAYYKDGPAGAHQGAAYVFVASGGTWTQQAKLMAADGAADDELGWSVAVSGDTAVAGAFYKDGPAGVHQGAAYVFVRDGTAWTQQAKLMPADAAANDDFGWSVAVSGDTAVVGAYAKVGAAGAAQGAAYVFVRSGTAWTQQAKLTARDPAANDTFGYAVAISGDTIVVGADGKRGSAGSQQGAAYVFERSGGAWVQRVELTATDGAAAGHFGAAVALDGDLAVVGAHASSGGGGTPGAAYVFARGAGAWTQRGKLMATDGASGDRFGWAVALFGDTVLVGASYKTGPAGQYQGAVYAFAPCGTGWIQEAKLLAGDGQAGDRFGCSVSLSGDLAIAGAYLRYSQPGSAGEYQGAAYTFLLKHANGDPCATAEQCQSGLRVDGVCCDRACDGQCEACDVPGSVGTCTTVPSGQPHGARPACAGGGVCQGICGGASATACVFPGAATTCGAPACTDGVATSAGACTGAGACAPGATRSCGDYACGATDCKTTCAAREDCAPGRACVGGRCVVPPDGGLHLDGGLGGGDAASDAGPADGRDATAASDAPDGARRPDGGSGILRARGCECRASGGAGLDAASTLLALALLAGRRAGRRRRRAVGSAVARPSPLPPGEAAGPRAALR
jgi:hypothetical protein